MKLATRNIHADYAGYHNYTRFSSGEEVIVMQWYDDIDKEEFTGHDGRVWHRVGIILRKQFNTPKLDDIRWNDRVS